MDVTPNIKFATVLFLIIGASASTVGIAVVSNTNLNNQIFDLQADLNVTLGEYDDICLQYEDLLSNYSELLTTLSILSLENALLNQTFNNLSADFQDLQADYDSLTETYDTLVQDYEDLQNSYVSLQQQYTILEDLYDALLSAYNNLQTIFDELQLDFDNLQVAYTLLQTQYDTLCDTISQMVLPAQYAVFAEAVRRYYVNDYIFGDTYRGYTRFCRDVILHDSQISPFTGDLWFSDISDAFSDCLTYGSNTTFLASQIFSNIFWDWIPNWGGYDLSGNPTTDISTIVQWCCDNIDYEYDSKITEIQYSPLWDYPKFPVETAFRTLGDCEDQAILVAAYLESCGFETMMVIIHDSAWDSGAGLYHGVPMMWWDNTWGPHPQDGFSFTSFTGNDTKYDNGWWMFLDTTWNTPFGTDPAWLQWYIDTDPYQVFNFDKFSYAVCDTDGWTSPIP